MYKSIIAILLIGFSNQMIGQYVSIISKPDSTKPIITNDLSCRYANGIEAKTLRDHLRIIASDSLEGRETGQKGMDLAADYIAKNLNNMGLSPLESSKHSYFQPVAFTFSKWVDTDIYINGARFRHLWDYLIFPEKNESAPVISGPEVIFLGYGIEDPAYNDYKKVDVKGKIIMINKGEPFDKNGNSYITKTSTASDWSNENLDKKLKLAKSKGAKLVLIIEEDIKKLLDVHRNKLLGVNLELGNKEGQKLDIANSVHISTTIAKAIIGEHEKQIIKSRTKMAKGKPMSVKLPTDFVINMSKEVKVLNGKNIVGYIQGRTKSDEYVIVSAHYDHLGKRGDEIFNGADDNGSGTVSLLELAQSFQQAVLEANRPDRSVVFIWFCGEEKGLLGSQYYSENPLVPLEKTVADVNVDMVGRIDAKYKDNPDYIYVIGSDRLSSDLHKINEDANQKYCHLTLDYTYNAENDPNRYYFRSDHYNFAKKGVPSIFFFNGTHEDYHQPSDDIEKINFDKMAKVDKLIFHTVWELANRPDRIVIDGEVK